MSEPSEDRILYILKSRGAQTATALAERLDMTSVGARKILRVLLSKELVRFEDRREEVGRPKRYWSLSEAGHARFPDAHSDLTLELLTSVGRLFGEDGLDRLIADREKQTEAGYKWALSECQTTEARVSELAAMRKREGYMAEWSEEPDGPFMLIENHCPICAAASHCQGLCRSELAVFQAALGSDVKIERVEHVLSGARRCAYRITDLNTA